MINFDEKHALADRLYKVIFGHERDPHDHNNPNYYLVVKALDDVAMEISIDYDRDAMFYSSDGWNSSGSC